MTSACASDLMIDHRVVRARPDAMTDLPDGYGGVHRGKWERADESVRCSGFWAKHLHADRPTGLRVGPGSQMPVISNLNQFLFTM